MLEPFDDGFYELPLIDRVNILQGKVAQLIELALKEKVEVPVVEKKKPGRKPKEQ